MEEQLSLELKVLSSGKLKNSSLKKHLSRKKEQKPKQEQAFSQQKKQKKQSVSELLPIQKKELKLKSLSLEEVKTEEKPLEETPPIVHSPKEELLFDNQIHLIGVKAVAEMLGLAPKTIHNWVYLRKIPFVKCGQKVMFSSKEFKSMA